MEDDSGDPLCAAVRRGDADSALSLLDAGANVNGRGPFGETPLHWAALTGNVILARRLLEAGAATGVKDARARRTPLEWARLEAAKSPRDGHADVIAELESRTRKSTAGMVAATAGWAAAAAILVSLPLLFVYGYQLSMGGGADVAVWSFALVMIVAVVGVMGSVPFVFFPGPRRRALAVLAAAATALVMLFVTLMIAFEWRSELFAGAAERAAPIISAIESHVRDTGRPPRTLQDLVPRYLPAFPADLPNLEIVAEPTTPALFDGNDWILRAHVSTGVTSLDQFMYFPNQQYPDTGYGGRIERIGKWAYVHNGE